MRVALLKHPGSGIIDCGRAAGQHIQQSFNGDGDMDNPFQSGIRLIKPVNFIGFGRENSDGSTIGGHSQQGLAGGRQPFDAHLVGHLTGQSKSPGHAGLRHGKMNLTYPFKSIQIAIGSPA
jgi:hypothetical protein